MSKTMVGEEYMHEIKVESTLLETLVTDVGAL
jgi:hypothetical protein